MYYIYEISKNIWYQYPKKEGFLYQVSFISSYLMGHNINDTYPTKKGYWKIVGDNFYWINYPSREQVHYILYEDDKILNKDEVKFEADKYKEARDLERERRIRSGRYKYSDIPFEYRYDPVPDIHYGKRRSYYRRIHKSKKDYSVMKETEFITRRGLAEKKSLIISWSDDYPRCIQKNWKKYRKHPWK